ncbi:MAG: hypothetical protein J6Q39_07135 [Bacteroidales bacterium]|nr:hypothetical protein [Bacteroidales bacterium]
MWQGYNNYNHHFAINQYKEWLKEAGGIKMPLVSNKRHNCDTYNVPASFDIETSSIKDAEGNKHACMYLWAFGLNGSCIYGRTWGEFTKLLVELTRDLQLSVNHRNLIVYVHNLGYEFQFFRKRIQWVNDGVFSVKNRRPVYAMSVYGIQFRCSLILSNYKLAYVGANLLLKYPTTKKVGDLDYSKVRHYLTPITKKELEYQLDDVRVVMSYIQEKIEQEGDILNIPLTNTGYVRRYCRDYCLGQFAGDELTRKKRMFEYRVLMKDLSIQSEKEYQQLRKAFAGGFTHANPNYWNKIVQNVGSADLASSYPFAMISDYFPMSGGTYHGEVEDPEIFEYLISNFCCIFTVVLRDVVPAVSYDNYISASKCSYVSDDRVINNGRLVSASEIQITITELDWDIISKVYDWDEDSVEVFDMRTYSRGYLPRPLIMSILELYKNKTSLKGIDDKVIEYMVSKNMINSAYGMSVTNIVRDEITYTQGDEWEKEEADAASQLVSYNKQFNRFLFYAWGVWVTAHARHNLWEAILEFGDDYIYADTDSIKGINFDDHEVFFLKYNLNVRNKLSKMCRHYKIPFEYCEPKTKKGERKLIGVFEREEDYKLFKTIGAKRYIYEYDDNFFNMTVAGVNKNWAIPYLLYNYGGEQYHTEEWLKTFRLAYSEDPNKQEEAKAAKELVIQERRAGRLSYELVMHFFKPQLIIPAEHTGKQLLTYIEDKETFPVTDYFGSTIEVTELSAIHMEPTSYNFSISNDYTKFLKGIEDASF